eukprot:4107561-Prymnesium_polylepis.4
MYDSEGGLYASDEDDKSTPVFVPVAARNLAGSAWKNRRKEFEDLLPSQFRLVTSPEEWERECKSNVQYATSRKRSGRFPTATR